MKLRTKYPNRILLWLRRLRCSHKNKCFVYSFDESGGVTEDLICPRCLHHLGAPRFLSAEEGEKIWEMRHSGTLQQGVPK